MPTNSDRYFLTVALLCFFLLQYQKTPSFKLLKSHRSSLKYYGILIIKKIILIPILCLLRQENGLLHLNMVHKEKKSHGHMARLLLPIACSEDGPTRLPFNFSSHRDSPHRLIDLRVIIHKRRKFLKCWKGIFLLLDISDIT